MSTKEEVTRRDYREAKGYLEDLLGRQDDMTPAQLAEVLLTAAQSVKVQQGRDVLVLRFDLNDASEASGSPSS